MIGTSDTIMRLSMNGEYYNRLSFLLDTPEDFMEDLTVFSFFARQSFMQDILTKLVTSVRQGALGPDEASRTIHECAALLNLQLLRELPNNTLILSGMRKTVKANDVIRAFRSFGPIEDAAVAANQRGFGEYFCLKTVVFLTKA